MKIGILTHHSVSNFGANIQSTSTYFHLKRLGHDVLILNYKDRETQERNLRTAGKDQYALHQEFFNTYVKLSPILRNEDDVIAFVRDWEPQLVICGSDAVLRHKPGTSPDMVFPNPFWFTWLDKLTAPPFAAYLAASTRGDQLSSFSPDELATARSAFKHVGFFSTRDRWSSRQIGGITGNREQPIHCPDPAFSFRLDNEIPTEFKQRPQSERKAYILLQCNSGNLSNRWIREFCSRAHDRGLRVYGFPTPQNQTYSDLLDDCISCPLHPLAWYEWVKNAAGLITRLYHGLVCATSNGVPALFIDTQQRYPVVHRNRSRGADLARLASCPERVTSTVSARFFTTPEQTLRLLAPTHTPALTAYANAARDQYISCVQYILGHAQKH